MSESWLDTAAGQFHAAMGHPLPSEQELERTAHAEEREAALAAFNAAHRPGLQPAVPITPYEHMAVLAREHAERGKYGRDWIGPGEFRDVELTAEDLAEARERKALKRLNAFQHAARTAETAVASRGELSPGEVAAWRQQAEGPARGVAGASDDW